MRPIRGGDTSSNGPGKAVDDATIKTWLGQFAQHSEGSLTFVETESGLTAALALPVDTTQPEQADNNIDVIVLSLLGAGALTVESHNFEKGRTYGWRDHINCAYSCPAAITLDSHIIRVPFSLDHIMHYLSQSKCA